MYLPDSTAVEVWETLWLHFLKPSFRTHELGSSPSPTRPSNHPTWTPDSLSRAMDTKSKHSFASTGYIITKWVGFISAIWVQAIAGNNYGFSNYSVALKAVGNYNQVQLNSLGVAKDVGKALGVAAGFAADYLPPWLILLIGSVDGLIGYGVQWLVLSRRISPLPYWQMCVVLCMGGNSTTWMNTAVLVTSIRNFRNSRGPVVGILKGYIGLSTAIFTVLCSSLFSNDPAMFVFLLAVVPFAVCTVAMVFLHPVPASETKAELEQDRKNMIFLNTIATVLAFYLLLYDYVKMSGQVAALFLGLLLLAPLYLPARMLLLKLVPRKAEEDDNEEVRQRLLSETGEQPEGERVPREDEQVLASSSGTDLEQVEKPGKVSLHGPELGEDHSVVQVLKRFEFWLLFVSLLCGMGTGTVVINNLGQIGETLGYTDVGSFVSLTSVWGFFGRIGSGLVSEHFVRSSGLPRPVWLALSQLLMIVGFLVLISPVPGSLYVGSSITGLCYGIRLAVTVSTASELFGLKFFGLIYNILIINIPLGSFLFSGLLAGILYDYEAAKSKGYGNSILVPPSSSSQHMWDGFLFSSSGSSNSLNTQSCIGSHCYRLTFVIMLAICVLGFIADTAITLVTRPLYRKVMQSFVSKNKKHGPSS